MLRRKLWIGLLVFIVVFMGLGIGGFLIWVGNPHQAMPEALASLESDNLVRVETEPWITFIPVSQSPNAGLIFYPGGLVEAEAYAPPARALAEAGYLVIIAPMPLNLAVLNSDAAADVMAAYPEIENWAISGHSLGGAMAARFADQNPDLIDGLVLWASYPAESNDLSAQLISVSSIYGTLDGVALPETVLASKPLLPPDTIWVAVEGGNHAQFGWYGLQEGDNPATISREEQQAQVVEATLVLLGTLEVTNE